MAINFPNSPAVGDEYTAGGFTWTWTGSAWEKVSATTAAANDFVLLVGATGNTTYVLDRTYTSGRYAIDFVNDDTTYDIYFIAEDGTYAGYTNNAIAVVTADFSEVVVIGAANNETILFTYQGTATAASTAGDVATAGAYISSVVTSSLPNIDDTTVVNGGNFAANVQVHFIGQNAAVTAAKAVVRTSSTQLVVTRPDSFAVAQSPYTVRVTNPGIPVPAGSNAHLLSNAVTAGTNPVWVTGTTIVYNVGAATNITLLATDTEASDIDYTLVSGTLPAGLTLTEETGVISGTFSGAANEGDVTSITVRATDAGGNFLDRTFNLTANTAPTWTTPAGAIGPVPPTGAFSLQLVASTGSFGGALTYSLQSGALPAGLTLSSSGLISGTSNNTAGDTFNFTVRVTDEGGLFADQSFSALIQNPSYYSNITTYDWGVNLYDFPYSKPHVSDALNTTINSASGSGYDLRYSLDAGANFQTWIQGANFVNSNGQYVPVSMQLKLGSDYYSWWLQNNNWGNYNFRLARWARSGNYITSMQSALISVGTQAGWVHPAQWGSNIGSAGISQYYLYSSASLLRSQIIDSGNIPQSSTSIAWNGGSGGGFLGGNSSRAPWLFIGKNWVSGNIYNCFFVNLWTNTMSNSQYTLSAELQSYSNFIATENGVMILYNDTVAGDQYYVANTDNTNPWGVLIGLNGTKAGTFPSGMLSNASFMLNSAGNQVRVFVPGLGVYSTTNLQTWTLTAAAGDDYINGNNIQVLDEKPSAGQESIAWRPAGSPSSRTIKVGTRTK